MWRCLILLVGVLDACGSETPTSDRETVLAGEVDRKTKTIVLGINRLQPGQFQLRHVSVSMDSARFNYELEGVFTVSDGFSLEAFLMEREDATRIVRGQEVPRIWRTGVRNTSSWHIAMPTEGEYTFVIDNRVGEPEWKSVDSRVILSWDTIEHVKP